ncbi:KilA-N domain-containing protein [Xenorhabdus sp. XENO-10]|uniref:KilA-N domain-containing protein n=1 Tax=Xenorhabdus yunnanensis TaxID=3025878 RepID=A0ABT5LL09_9GAMM|nr:KilA-N domain-containing protein [Xenorhabdus yunnanensis]MDC9591136.1 KilA-N domain-containing protein [Xenorhabdus yunnanensis]
MTSIATNETYNTNQIIISDISIHQDTQGRYSLNDLHKASGGEQRHRPKYWLELQQTNDLIDEILKGGIPPFKNEILNAQILAFKPVDSRKGRHGGTYVCKELVYSYAMWISAAYALKVIRAYDDLVNGRISAVKIKTTSDDRTPLRKAVSYLVGRKKMIYKEAYELVHHRFNVEHIDELPMEQIPLAVEYIHKLALEGEYLGKEELPSPQSAKMDLSLELNNIGVIYKQLKKMTDIWKESIYPALELVNSPIASKFHTYLWDVSGAAHSTKCAIERKAKKSLN